MVLSLALCGTLAFAQNSHRVEFKTERPVVAANNNAAALVDYKASIFTKENDTLKIFNFDSACWAEMTFGTLSATDMIAGDTVGLSLAHNQSNFRCTWNRIEDSATVESEGFVEAWQETYQGMQANISWLGQAEIGSDNGFALMSMMEATVSGAINAYMAFPAFTPDAAQTVVDIRLTQLYRCFNDDRCYVDYKVGNNWKTREINVRGVDCEVNNWAAIAPTYTMPLELCAQPSYEIRIRWASNNNDGGIYGYYWAIDDLVIASGADHRLKAYTQTYVDGAYGMMPKDMRIPLSWMAKVANTGSQNVTGTQILLRHAAPGDTVLSTIGTYTQAASFASGDPELQYNVKINERRLLDSLDNGSAWYSYMLWNTTPYFDTNLVPANYVGVPSTTTGDQYIATAAIADDMDTIGWRPISYRVVNATTPYGSNALAGYRWAHDNGFIASRSAFHGGYINRNGVSLITDEGAYGTAGYLVAVRYTTGSEIPTDAEGHPWVLRGIEIVPSTDSVDVEAMEGSAISPICYTGHYYGDGSISLGDVETGFSNSTSYYVDADDKNLEELEGYIAPGEDYAAVNMKFPNQPELKPNTAYYLGYYVDQAGYFAANLATDYYYDEARSTYRSIANDEDLSRYATQFTPDGFDMLVRDPVGGVYSATYAVNQDAWPMIRAIVGPRMQAAQYHIYGKCETGSDSVFVSVLNSTQEVDLCGDEEGVSYYEGSSTYFFITPGDTTHSVIDKIVINDIAYDPEGDDNLPANMTIVKGSRQNGAPFDVIDPVTGEVVLERDYYILYVENIAADMTIGATAHWGQWGIDPVAENVFVGVQPNPATSQVKISVSGVNGVVNCSILDMSGRVVYNSDMNADNVKTIDLSSFARGAYFVRITNDSFSKVEKLIVR